MNRLTIRLFGQLELVRGGVSLSRFPTRKAKTLFSYLALHSRRSHPREVLAGTFWPEKSEAFARKRLRNELWLLRNFIESENHEETFLRVCHDSVGFNPRADVWIDVAEFEDQLLHFEDGPTPPVPDERPCLQETVELYRGDLLEGHYEDWALEARERLRDLLLCALENLMSLHQRRRDWSSAISYGKRILRHDPLAEHVYRDLMRCYWEQGNRTAALRQYRHCADLLRAELEVEPMHETLTLFRQIRAGDVPRRS